MNSYLEITSSGRRVTLVDYLKGFSIFTIALMHLMTFMPSIPSPIITLSAIGGTGVHVFFLCSGIGLYTSYLHNNLGFTEFLKKRFSKVYTPYILVVMVSFLLPWMYTEEHKAAALLSHIFLYKMFIPEYMESFGEQFWFVSTIFQLYLLFIPMCLWKEKLRNNKSFVFFHRNQYFMVDFLLCNRYRTYPYLGKLLSAIHMGILIGFHRCGSFL